MRLDLVCIVHYIELVPEYLGEFGQFVLLAVARAGDEAYGVTIRRMLVERAGRRASFGASTAHCGGSSRRGCSDRPSAIPFRVRGGRAKKHVALTVRGRAALRAAHTALMRMAEGVAELH